jgi:hypothetical protein
VIPVYLVVEPSEASMAFLYVVKCTAQFDRHFIKPSVVFGNVPKQKGIHQETPGKSSPVGPKKLQAVFEYPILRRDVYFRAGLKQTAE